MERIRNAVVALAVILAAIRTYVFVAGTKSPNLPSLGASVDAFDRFAGDPTARVALFWYILAMVVLAVVAGLAWFIAREVSWFQLVGGPKPPRWTRRWRNRRAGPLALTVIRNRGR